MNTQTLSMQQFKRSQTARNSVSKKITQVQTVVSEHGEVINHSHTATIPQEPNFVKLYLDDILYLKDMPRGLNPVLNVFLRHMNYENIIIINAALKRRMSEEIGLSVASINKAITAFVKGDILKRQDTGMYLVNPYLFGKGKWENIREIRLQVTYNLDGRSFSEIAVDKNDQLYFAEVVQ